MYLKFCLWFLLLSLLLTGCKSTESSMSDITSSELENLFFREDWREIAPQVPITQEHVQNPDLVLGRHGPAGEKLKKSNHDNIPNDPWYVWSGLCDDLWAISLHKKGSLVDMTEGRIRCRTRQTGYNVMKFIVELEDGTWLVSELGLGETLDWHEFDVEFNHPQFRWQRLDINAIKAREKVKNPDLRRVRSIGWTDLMTGRGSNACTRVDWIEVYGEEIRLR